MPDDAVPNTAKCEVSLIGKYRNIIPHVTNSEDPTWKMSRGNLLCDIFLASCPHVKSRVLNFFV